MERFLFVFGYESPAERRSNDVNVTDFESSNAVWVHASSEEEAIAKGRIYADEFVANLYRDLKVQEARPWSEEHCGCWISKNPLEEFSVLALQTLDEI